MVLRLEPRRRAPGFISIAVPENSGTLRAERWELESPGGVKVRVPEGLALSRLAEMVRLLERR